MTRTLALACLALLASPLALPASADVDAGCFHAETYAPGGYQLETRPETHLDPTRPAYWERYLVQSTSYIPCQTLADLFACLAHPDSCLEWEHALIESLGITYEATRHSTVAGHEDCPPLPLSDYEVLVTYNTKGFSGSVTLAPVVCVLPISLPF